MVSAEQPARAGSPFGSLAQGPASGHDIRPALPLVFPNPGILPWQVPSGVEGNVIVEVTIDEQGNVTETKVLQGLGHGIEEKVVAACAKIDGAEPSRLRVTTDPKDLAECDVVVEPDGQVLFSDYAELTEGMREGVLRAERQRKVGELILSRESLTGLDENARSQALQGMFKRAHGA